MKKIKLGVSLFASVLLMSGCSKLSEYTPQQGGSVDTLHNEIHVATYNDLLNLSEEEKGKDVGKTYITDDDSLKYYYRFNTVTNQWEYVRVSETDTTINFYFDFNQTTRAGDKDNPGEIDCPIFTYHWYMMKPMMDNPILAEYYPDYFVIKNDEEMSDVAKKELFAKKLQEIVLELGAQRGFAPQYDFTNLKGFSAYSSCLGDYEHLWNFEKDHRTQAVTNLYGVWVDD